eukprot:GFUD01035138.1.p1 GENE.GFUD01035138.1~~GFUD01035138.1.p1  ORF type:complete len:247 (+),score=65.91 GFUD01035138.1:62-802(+)
MEQSEIDSFVIKFQHLCCAGRNANLSFTSKAGKASVNLSVELGSLCLPVQRLHQPPPYLPHHSRNGPSRQRRRENRAKAQKTAAEKATQELSTEEAEVLALAEVLVLAEEAYDKTNGEKDAEEAVFETAKDTNNTEKVFEEPTDELCSDNVYDEEPLDDAEAARDKLVEKVLIYPVKKPDEKKSKVETEIREKFGVIGVTVKMMKTTSTRLGEFNGSMVEISPVNLNRIWGRRLGLENCSIISFEE